MAANMSTSVRSCSTPSICAASPGATPPTAPAGRRRCSCRRPVTPASGSSIWRSFLPPCRWSRPRSISSCSTAKSANTSSPRARRSSPAATARAPAAWSTACRRRSPRASSTSRSASMPRTGWSGARPTESPRKCCSSAARTDAPAPVRSAVEGEGIPVPEDMGIHQQHRAPPQRPRPGGRARAVPRHHRRGRGGRVRRLPQGLARAAPSPGRHQRPRERRHPGRTRAL